MYNKKHIKNGGRHMVRIEKTMSIEELCKDTFFLRIKNLIIFAICDLLFLLFGIFYIYRAAIDEIDKVAGICAGCFLLGAFLFYLIYVIGYRMLPSGLAKYIKKKNPNFTENVSLAVIDEENIHCEETDANAKHISDYKIRDIAKVIIGKKRMLIKTTNKTHLIYFDLADIKPEQLEELCNIFSNKIIDKRKKSN